MLAHWWRRVRARCSAILWATSLCWTPAGIPQTESSETEGESTYIGETDQGKRHGYGRQEWPDGRVYEGWFQDDRMNDDNGLMTWPDGRAYRGSFVRGSRDGTGSMSWPNGDIYTGDFRAGKISGQGTFVWKNSSNRYQGSFIDGIRHGYGVFSWSDGRRYEGEFVNGKQEGWGLMLQAGSSFRGQFEDGLRQGVGIWTADNKDWYQIWERGERRESAVLAETPHCRLQIEGQPWMFKGNRCINGLAHGTGLAARLDGRYFVLDGRFVLGTLVDGEVQRLYSAGAP